MPKDNQTGLITFLSNNYGTCLQAFAMRRALESLGMEVTFLCFNRKTEQDNSNPSTFQRIIQAFLHQPLRDLLHYRKYKAICTRRVEKFELFKNILLQGQPKCGSSEELTAAAANLSAVVCGSDMIWSPEFDRYLDIYLLTWCPTGIRRIAYAPSIGNTAMGARLEHKYRTALSAFDSVSCREASGASFLSELTNKDIPVVVDPTLLFDAKKWDEWIKPSAAIKSQCRPYILVYCFGGITNTMRKRLKKLAKVRGFDIRYLLGNQMGDTLRETKYGDGANGPEEYVRLFANATFTVVNGYHGLLFSLIYERPFVLLHRDDKEHWGKHESRMSDLLRQLNLETRYISPNSVIGEDYLSLDYTDIRTEIDRQRQLSWNYLKQAIA